MADARIERIGDATLYLADCREVLPTLPKVDAVVTSPPYNTLSNIPSRPTGIWAQSQWVSDLATNGYADDLPEEDYVALQNDLFSQINVTDTASLFYNHQIRWRDGVLLHPVQWFKPNGWNLRQEIVWDRCGGMMFNARMFCRFDERILWFVRDQWKWNQESVGLGTVWRINKAQNKDHPVAYPLEIPSRCIGAATDRRDSVLDPFMGSGTTGVAAIQLGRKFIGIEREPKYFDIACERISRAVAQGRLFEPEPVRAEQDSLL